MKQARKFFPHAIILAEKMDMFQSASGTTQEGGPDTSAPDAFALVLFFLVSFYFLQCLPIFFPRCNNIRYFWGYFYLDYSSVFLS